MLYLYSDRFAIVEEVKLRHFENDFVSDSFSRQLLPFLAFSTGRHVTHDIVTGACGVEPAQNPSNEHRVDVSLFSYL